ncbi:MAG: 16S rRNA (adenine(1518)-N(6)/adenine(1519)-N(6))-dimethyltransferase [Rickettsiales bacterium]|nr:16S rRNA (adenine(1518)-N(6)/adenine(1519)-N(6))-dimethyltransferase [Rickettsiales bacterium]|tara:strand:+ start:10263 stop:11093 length:831 start_codon:yes stop_codon:yes gene_type:complete
MDKIYTLPTTSDFIKKYNLNAKKSLGQNFILDQNYTDKIVKSAGDITNKLILEIGPGPASLTRSILKKNIDQLICIEKDQRCLNILQEIKQHYPEKLDYLNEDALTINEVAIFNNQKFTIIANLPYNIATLLIFKWLKIADKISSMTLMVQKEVAQRITAKFGQKHYSRMSIMINYLCDSKINFIVNNSIFTPKPKVTSAIINLTPKISEINLEEFNKLEKIVAMAFNTKRKTIKNSLKNINNICNILDDLKIAHDLRAQDLTIEQYLKLANIINF